MRDPYAVLGLDRSASETDIKNAFRRQAKRLHPDMHDGDAGLEARFQEIQAAYALLRDRAQRQRYDAGEIDASGNPRPQSFEEALRAARQQQDAEAASGRRSKAERDTLFAEFLATFRKARRTMDDAPPPSAPAPPAGPLKLALTFAEAVTGARKTLALPSGKRIAVTVPPGAQDGQRIHMRNASAARDVPDELEVVLDVAPDARFTREGYDLVATLPITLGEALLGAKIRLDAPAGELLVTIPAGANTGTVLKLRGQGVPRGEGEPGDLKLTLALKLPPVIDADLEAFMKAWVQRHPYAVRDHGRD